MPINFICPYAHDHKLCHQAQQMGEAWHLFHCPLRQRRANMADQIPTTVELFLSIHKRLEQITNSLTELHAAVNSVIKKEKQMTTEMLVLKEKVAQNTNLVDSAITLINGISTQLEAIKGDPAAITEFIAELEASNSELAAKIVENTPAA